MHQGAGGGGDQPGRGAHPDRPPVPGGTPAGASETVSWAWPWSNTAVRHRRCRTSMASTPLRVIFTTTVTSPSRCPPAADHDQAAGQLRRTRPPAWARERGDMRAESLTVRLTGRPTAGRGSSGRAWLHDGGAAGIFRLPMARSPDCTFPSASPAPKERRADAIRRRARSRGVTGGKPLQDGAGGRDGRLLPESIGNSRSGTPSTTESRSSQCCAHGAARSWECAQGHDAGSEHPLPPTSTPGRTSVTRLEYWPSLPVRQREHSVS